MRSRWCSRTAASAMASSMRAPISWRIICAGSASVPRVVVGLCVERSLEMVVGLLGILKAGGAYLPLDPGLPAGTPRLHARGRRRRRVLVTQIGAARSAARVTRARIVRLDADWPAIAAQPATAPQSRLHPHNTAYVIYTSGSTGTPKGVGVSTWRHRQSYRWTQSRCIVVHRTRRHVCNCAAQLRCFDVRRFGEHCSDGAKLGAHAAAASGRLAIC